MFHFRHSTLRGKRCIRRDHFYDHYKRSGSRKDQGFCLILLIFRCYQLGPPKIALPAGEYIEADHQSKGTPGLFYDVSDLCIKVYWLCQVEAE